MRRMLIAFLLAVASGATADTLLVVNKGDATLAFVDPASLKVTATVATGADPHEVAVSDDGKIAVVCNYGGDAAGTSLSIVDVAAKRELRRYELPGLSRPHGIQAAGSRFYFTAEGSFAVARYDTAANGIDWIAGTGQDMTHMLVVTRDEKKLYTTNIASNSVTVVGITRSALKHVPVARGPEGLDLSPDGSVLWVAGVASRAEQAKISIIDTNSNAVVRTIATPTKLANRLRFSPDGKHVVISDPGTNEIAIFDAATETLVRKVTMAAGPAGLLFTPDGTRLFVACADAGKVQIVDTATWTIAGEIATGTTPDGMAYRRD